MKKKFTIFCFVFALCTNINTANAQANVQDSLALVDLYNSTNGPDWKHHENWLTTSPVSTWFGITADVGTRYMLINLSYNQLSGSIPSSIGNLLHLESLFLSNNQLSGGIPSSLGNLLDLQGLNLSNNRLRGGIPSSIGSHENLLYIELSSNQLSGSIPSTIGNLANPFLGLYLSHNYFTFDGMELIAQRLPKSTYYPQRLIPVHQNGNTLYVSAGGTLSNNTYKWFRCDGTTSTLVVTIKGDSVFHPSETGRYHVKVLNSVATQLQLYSGATDYTAPGNGVIASAQNELQQYDKGKSLIVYPNPAKDILYVKTNGNASFSLLNQSGKILLTANINGKGSMDISGMAAGLYYIKNNATGAVQKVVITR